MHYKLIAIAALASGLSACGGGGSSNGDTGTATITTTSPTLRDAATEGTPVISPVGVSLNDSSPSFSLAADGTISVERTSSDLEFAPGDTVTAALSGSTLFVNNGNQDGAIIAVPAGSTLDYTAFGLWIDGASEDLITVDGDFTVVDAGTGFFGVQTTPADMPTTGSATYLGTALGLVAQGNEVQDLLNGSLLARADFGTSELDLTIDLLSSNGVAFGQLSVDDATIDTGSSAFSTAAGGAVLDSGQTGSLSGSFFGPAAAEIGGQFDLSDSDSRVIGAFGGQAR